jgi:CHAT domain-containing protein
MYPRFCLIVLLSSLAVSPLTAQETAFTDWSVGADSLQQWWRSGKHAAADSLFAHWTELAQVQDDLALYFDVVGESGKFWRRAGEPQRAARIGQRILPDQLWRMPANVEEKENLGWALVNLGYLYRQSLGQYYQARQFYHQAAEVFAEMDRADGTIARYVWLPLANLSTRLGDYQAAEAFLLRSIETPREQDQANALAMAYADLGILYQSWQKPTPARRAYEQGLALTGVPALTEALLRLNLCRLLLDQLQLLDAQAQLDLAARTIDRAATESPTDRRLHNRYQALYQHRAELAVAREDYPTALSALQRGHEHLTAYYGTTQRREFGKHYNQVARIYRKQGEYHQAIQEAQRALAAVLHEYEAPHDPFSLPSDDAIYAENTIEEALEEMALNFRAWNRATGKLAYLQQALHCYEKIHLVDQALRRSYLYESSKLDNLEDSRRRAEAAISIARELFERTGDPAYTYQALIFAERDRSHLLREAYRSTRANALAGIDGTLQAEEQQLQFLVREAEEALFYYKSKSGSDSLILVAAQQLLLARDSLHQFLQTLESENPRYYQLKYADDTPSLEALRAMLPAGQLLVEYFVGTEELFVFTLTHDTELRLLALPLPPDLEERIMRWRRSIESYQEHNVDRPALLATYRQDGYELYRALLAPVLADQEAHSLLFIPSGMLDLLPFEALLQEVTDAQTNLREYPYLLRQYSCSYSYSASLQYTLQQLPYAGEGFGGYSPLFDGRQGWQALYCSSQKLSEVPWSGTRVLYLGQTATRDNFLQHAGQFSVLHLATHAQANAERGDFSFVVFSDGETGYDSLFAQSLYHLDLPNELVLLSACETALGTLHQSEGVISLARAFQYAGARSVLTTLWQVNEGANCRLMPAFYAHLDEGANKASALHQAKLAYLDKADERAAHPVYWAGYQMLGNARPLSRTTSKWWWLVGGGLLFFLVGWWYQHRRSAQQ